MPLPSITTLSLLLNTSIPTISPVNSLVFITLFIGGNFSRKYLYCSTSKARQHISFPQHPDSFSLPLFVIFCIRTISIEMLESLFKKELQQIFCPHFPNPLINRALSL